MTFTYPAVDTQAVKARIEFRKVLEGFKKEVWTPIDLRTCHWSTDYGGILWSKHDATLDDPLEFESPVYLMPTVKDEYMICTIDYHGESRQAVFDLRMEVN